MTTAQDIPLGVSVKTDVEYRAGRPKPYKARARWIDPTTGDRRSKSESFATPEEAQDWIDGIVRAANGGIDPAAATQRLAEYGDDVMPLAIRGLERKTLDPYLAGWRLRVVPSLGHIPVRMITNGVVDRAVHAWIADECSRSTVKNSIAILVRVLEQALRDGVVQHNVARVTGWQREYERAEDELDDPRSLALPDWEALTRLADALVAQSHGRFTGWGHVVTFAACTAARIGEVSGVRAADIDRRTWTWTVRRQTTPGPGGLIDKGTKGKRARKVPIIEEVREMVTERLDSASGPDGRLFTGPRGGRISTAVLRDATHWDQVVTALGYEHLRRHDLRHTGLTWMADAGVPVHVLRKIAGHGSLMTTQRYLHPDQSSIEDAGTALSAHLGRAPGAGWSPNGPQLRAV
ncbi:phage integrase family protein [Krasilnikovia cinnamomea]|uniref:Phage integrase family protein n=1 Tax=Krasilnikovia cinnamomea TaxID=349313 RepID=A0A4Q7ZDY9_9ACTN|nr:site-specific integrase [Krasilnikovia cinnamomea]RZU48868.1 phage integrase family protein [Krasilnikovia cinnamomea]